MTEEKEEIWIAEAVTAEMIEEVVAVVTEEAAVVGREVVVDKVEEVVDQVVGREVAVDKAAEVEGLVVAVEVAEAEEPVAVVGEEEIKKPLAISGCY